MPLTRKEYNKQYRKNNKEKIKEKTKEWREQNKEHIKKYNLQWREENQKYLEDHKEIKKDYSKKYHQLHKNDPEVIKGRQISKWRLRGIIDPDLESVYDYSLTQTHCWICFKEYNKNNTMDRRCLDHEHDTGEPRYICCHDCNIHVIR